jgi:hypothetical protein
MQTPNECLICFDTRLPRLHWIKQLCCNQMICHNCYISYQERCPFCRRDLPDTDVLTRNGQILPLRRNGQVVGRIQRRCVRVTPYSVNPNPEFPRRTGPMAMAFSSTPPVPASPAPPRSPRPEEEIRLLKEEKRVLEEENERLKERNKRLKEMLERQSIRLLDTLTRTRASLEEYETEEQQQDE